MNMKAPQFLFVGTNSQVLETYRRTLVDHFASNSIRVASSDEEIASLKPNGKPNSNADSEPIGEISAIFIDVEHLSELKKWNSLSKISTLMPPKVPIIVISHVDEAQILALDPRFRVLKKPLLGGELLHEAKNVIVHQDYVSQTVQSERLAAMRLVLRGIAHELGNIVLRLAGKADLAMMEDTVPAIHHQVEGVVEAAQRASMLVKNIQSFAKSQPHFVQGKITQAIEGALERLESTIVKQKVVIQKNVAFENGEPETFFDFKSILQAFFNIFENSILAMPQGGALRIEVSTTGADTTQSIRIQISDSGVGMTPDVLKRAFEFGYSARKERASGLGLPVARELFRSHGGGLDLQSAPERGTQISIWLPVRPC